MTTYTLRYALEGFASASSSSSSSGIATYSLVELPAALAAAAKSALSSSDASSSILSKLVIKGQPNDDAVLCTDDTTYTMRSVQNSNSLLLCRPQLSGSGSSSKGEGKGKGKGKKRATADYLNIESTLHQTLELDLCVPRLEKIGDLLRGQEWTPEINEEERQEQLERGSEQHPLKKRKRNRRHHRSMEDILDLVPASDAQIMAALASRRVLTLDGCCRPIPPATLTALLQNILQTLVMLSHSPSAVAGFPLDELASSLCKDDGIPEDVTKQVIQWFGEPVEPVQGSEHMSRSTQHWRLKVDEVAREIGRNLLARNGNKAVPQETFMRQWRETVGEQFSDRCELALLTGYYLLQPSRTASTSGTSTLTYFPTSSLPLDPASRFSELFSLKSRWKASEIQPFLADLAVDAKKRDALTLKFTRKIKDDATGELWFAARGR